jgi:hypothetical protein
MNFDASLLLEQTIGLEIRAMSMAHIQLHDISRRYKLRNRDTLTTLG